MSTPYHKQDPASIRNMFSNIASRYDTGNAFLSFQMHRFWNRKLVRTILLPKRPKTLLDLCCGTGEISFTYRRELKKAGYNPTECTITLVDFSEAMIDEAKRKGEGQEGLYFITGDAQDIPLASDSVDAVVIAYGIRNVADPARCLSEVYRVLRPGGQIGILELTRPTNPLLRLGHALYLRTVVPILGRLVTSNSSAYKYLCSSVQAFIPPEKLHEAIEKAQFTKSWRRPLMGGIATLFFGEKGANYIPN